MRNRLNSFTVLLTAVFAATVATQMHAQAATDKYTWLEDVSSGRSMAWVKAENARTAKVLEADPRFAQYEADALKIAEAPDRLPAPGLRGNDVYNFWRDAAHVRGILRKTTLADYLTEHPQWQTVIDIDALGRQDKMSWVSEGMSCLYPGDHYCLVNLSNGGEDAVSSREFDLKTGKFVEGGFVLPRSKQHVTWLDKDTLLIARDWGPGTMTKSGYPFVVKEWKRGTPLDQAKEVFRGQESDINASAYTLHDAQGESLTVYSRGLTFFESQTMIKTSEGMKQVAIPEKAGLAGLISGRVLLSISVDWTPAGQTKSVLK
jgi:prolyl oligopeptidase